VLCGALSGLLLFSIAKGLQLKREKSEKHLHLFLLTLTLVNTTLYSISQAFYSLYDLALQDGDEAMINLWLFRYIFTDIVGYSFQNAIIIQILFMWIELFNNIKYGDFVEQERSAKRYTIVRIMCMVFIWLATFLFSTILGIVDVSTSITYVSYILTGLFVIVTLIIASIRWRSLYLTMSDCLKRRSKNGDRFIDLTIVTVLAIYAFVMDFVFSVVLNDADWDESLTFYIFLNLLPNFIFPLGIWYYFTPMFRKSYSDDSTIPGVPEMDTHPTIQRKRPISNCFTFQKKPSHENNLSTSPNETETVDF